jgi:hypothetical protein
MLAKASIGARVGGTEPLLRCATGWSGRILRDSVGGRVEGPKYCTFGNTLDDAPEVEWSKPPALLGEAEGDGSEMLGWRVWLLRCRLCA